MSDLHGVVLALQRLGFRRCLRDLRCVVRLPVGVECTVMMDFEGAFYGYTLIVFTAGFVLAWLVL